MDRLSVRAEQALLGSVLSDPAGQQHVLALAEPGDMYRPWHAQVLGAMHRLRERGTSPGPLEVYAELQNDPDLPASVSRDAVPLADLMQTAPRMGHAGVYAAMVAEGGIRRRLVLAGSRMAQAAETGDLGTAVRQAMESRREVDTCRARWMNFPERLRVEPPAPLRDDQGYAEIARSAAAVRDEIGRLRENLWLDTAAGREDRLAMIAQRLAEIAAASADHRERLAGVRSANQVRPSGPASEAASRRAVRDLAAGPCHLARVHGWLWPEHFASAEHGELYAVMRDIDVAGRPVDPVTIIWEAARRGLRADPADLAAGTGAFAITSAREVRRYGLLAQVAHAGRNMQADASDLACRPSQIFRSAGDRFRSLAAQLQPDTRPTPAATVTALRHGAETSPKSRQPDREAVR